MGEWKYLVGDAREVLKTLPEKSIQVCVTSPPYWGLRDYGIEGQLGLEPTPELYVQHLVEIFQGVRRVLRDDGTLWLNLGDSYNGSGGDGGDYNEGGLKDGQPKYPGRNVGTLKPKDLVGIPWRVAFALQADGWWLRSDIIWSKPNPMPESVTDRPTKAHEYIFLLTKNGGKSIYWVHRDLPGTRQKPKADYRWLDNLNSIEYSERPTEFTQEKMLCPGCEGKGAISGWFGVMDCEDCGGKGKIKRWSRINLWRGHDYYYDADAIREKGGNKRTVWTIATQPYPEAHFATFPEALVELCILAGSSPKACGKCGAPWERDIDYKANYEKREQAHVPNNEPSKVDSTGWKEPTRVFKGWKPTCKHNDDTGSSIVLDPFVGSGTVLAVARRLGRSAIGIDINPEYEKLAKDRAKLRIRDIDSFGGSA